MHGGVPPRAREYHLVVAIFERPRESASRMPRFTATISGLGHVGETRIALDQMPIAGFVTYGGFVSLPGRDRYAIAIEIRRRAQTASVKVNFSYDLGAE